MEKNKKTFRLNVTISYHKELNLNNYRPPLLNMMKHIAWLYELDYAIVEDNPFEFSADSDTPEHPTHIYADLIYFRATNNTRIECKDLRRIISCIGGKSLLFSHGVDVGYQLCKYLSKYPFPKKYYHALNYPYVEHYEGDRTRIYVPDFPYTQLPLMPYDDL
jgi:hypothetical protein